MHEEPDTLTTPKRVISKETEREKFHNDTQAEYLSKVDQNLHDIKKQHRLYGLAFILKYIGAWYIVLAIFKGLFYKFSPSFDLIGLFIFLLGFVVDAITKRKTPDQ